MKSSTSIQLLDTQNNSISPITSIESLYFDASYNGNGDYVRYRVYDRIPFLGVSGAILKDNIDDTANLKEFIVGVNAEKTTTGPLTGDPSIYRLKYKSLSIEKFETFIDGKIDKKLETYLEPGDVLGGNGITAEVNGGSTVAVSAKVDGKTIEFNENGELYAPGSAIALEERVTALESSVGDLSTNVYKKISDLDSSIDARFKNTDASIGEVSTRIDVLNTSVNQLNAYIDYMFGGVTTHNSLSNIPVSHQSVYVTLTGAKPIEYLSLAGKLNPGQDMNIRVVNLNSTQSIKIYLVPSATSAVDDNGMTYNLMSAKVQTLAKNNFCEINVWCYSSTEYSVKYIFKEI